MKVIAFSVARFTPDDLADWRQIAEPKLARGLWERVERITRPESDRLVVRFPGLDRPVFRFERDRAGIYRLSFNDRQGWYEIGCGDTAGDCLSVWRGRLPRTEASSRDMSAGR